MKQRDADVIVVGGGHAGCEAAHAAARTGATVMLVTMAHVNIGTLSCNPAIGGLGKGHLVREIDALDGLMGRVADYAGIQFRLLNRKKGPAVQGPRAQADRARYKSAMHSEINQTKGLRVLVGEVVDLIVNGDVVTGVMLNDGSVQRCGAVVLTAGTFLRGRMHIGNDVTVGGRAGEPASVRLAHRFVEMGLPLGRLKTGTPPRLDGRSIDWDVLGRQEGDETPSLFSFLSDRPVARQISCGIAETNRQTHDIIRRNLALSAIHAGNIEGVGPRYCPSIEDKVVRFSEKHSHNIFLEPEGLDDATVYPNGISTSLPAAIQIDLVRSIKGLEAAEVTQFGYAVEYDYVDPRALHDSLAVAGMSGLFLAGQINGTTGYEEAAAQGLVAGLNAARLVTGLDAIRLDRRSSYIGVMIDDLVSRGVSEPYRMFTSRAEMRLSMRADNADQRLTDAGREWGCVSDARWRHFCRKKLSINVARAKLAEIRMTAQEISGLGIRLRDDGPVRSGLDVLTLVDSDFGVLARARSELADIPPSIGEQIARDQRYAVYLERQERDLVGLRRQAGLALPSTLPYEEIAGLSSELKSKLARLRPKTLRDAGQIEGMTPAALLLLTAHVRRHHRDAVL